MLPIVKKIGQGAFKCVRTALLSTFHWNGEDKKTCDWIGKNDSRRENLCEFFLVECAASMTIIMSSPLTIMENKKCNWLTNDKRKETFCSTMHFGALVANKCFINCGICKFTESLTL